MICQGNLNNISLYGIPPVSQLNQTYRVMAIQRLSRRKFAKTTAVAAVLSTIIPGLFMQCSKDLPAPDDPDSKDPVVPAPMKRVFGKIGFEVTTMGLGGQAALQWTPEFTDPVQIILKAFSLGINYFDTSNYYGSSQTNYGRAFHMLKLIPGLSDYDENLRKSIFITSKTHLRYAKGNGNVEGVHNGSNGSGTNTIDDLHRSLSQMFGDGNGNYPAGAYLDMMLIHDLTTMEEVEALYEGVDNTDANAERIGAIAALRDYRDGTNLTGLNPGNEKLINHIGFSGHFDPSVNMYMIQSDRFNLLDAILIPINANDKQMYNMQYNVIPLASAKNMGIIAMKVFADGAMYSKPAEWTNNASQVIRSVGSESLPSNQLIKYSLTTPGIHLAIIGIGKIGIKTEECQLTSNLEGAQILPDGLTESERTEIEGKAKNAKNGMTNYFQAVPISLTAPKEISIDIESSSRNVTLKWTTGYAGDSPINVYEIWRDGAMIKEFPFTPQISSDPFSWTELINDSNSHSYTVKVIDQKGRIAESEAVTIG